jgi:hypothetical protein
VTVPIGIVRQPTAGYFGREKQQGGQKEEKKKKKRKKDKRRKESIGY